MYKVSKTVTTHFEAPYLQNIIRSVSLIIYLEIANSYN